MNDSGNIKCVATNILGRATTVANLTIEASPRLELPENYNDGLIFRYDEVIWKRMRIINCYYPTPGDPNENPADSEATSAHHLVL